MWQWFTVNGLEILIWSIAVLVALIITMHRLENRAEKRRPGRSQAGSTAVALLPYAALSGLALPSLAWPLLP